MHGGTKSVSVESQDQALLLFRVGGREKLRVQRERERVQCNPHFCGLSSDSSSSWFVAMPSGP